MFHSNKFNTHLHVDDIVSTAKPLMRYLHVFTECLLINPVLKLTFS
ncbi:protein of unknown function [Shewanella benthica]|uniref:Uncharacterized protein n=1 Tax=Shewanella benthica TaxID=43661 RepID=A0A330M468_9GAMM|nr:protein of unknown function [Shewanella benthica]